MATNSRAGLLQECREAMAGVDRNEPELLHVVSDRSALGGQVQSIEDLTVLQNFHQAEYQKATRALEFATKQARELLVRLKNAIRASYGLTNEKLLEFGMPVRRFGRRATEKKKPAEAGPTQPQPAASETDGAIQK